MSTELDVAKMMWGWGASGGSGSSRPGSSYGTQTVTRYGTVQSVNDDGTVTILLDSGETVTLKTDTPLRVGDRVVVVAQGGTYLVYSMAGTVGMIENTRTELAQDIIDEGQAIRDEVDKEMNDFKADHKLTDADITSSIEQTKSEITATFEGQISAVEDDIEKNYATKTEVSTGIDGLRTEVSETYATSEGVTDEINSAITQASGEISSEVEQNVMNSIGDTYATKTELTQTADSLELTISSSIANAYGTCSTAASTSTKVATTNLSNFTRKQGMTVAVKFTYANTASSPRLNVNSTGAAYIRLGNSNLTVDDSWDAGDVVTFVFDGTYWQIADPSLSTAKTVESYFTADATGLEVGRKNYSESLKLNTNGRLEFLIDGNVSHFLDTNYVDYAGESLESGVFATGSANQLALASNDGGWILLNNKRVLLNPNPGRSFLVNGYAVNEAVVDQFSPTYNSAYGTAGSEHWDNMRAIVIYYRCVYSGNTIRSTKVYITPGQTVNACFFDTMSWPGGGVNMTICSEQITVSVNSSATRYDITRGTPGRASISQNNVSNYNPNPGNLFQIMYVVLCI